jgi:hypothetical protein
MKVGLWLTYALAIAFLVVGLRKGLGPLLVFRGNIESISFIFGLLVLIVAFAKTTGLFSKKKDKVLTSDFDDEFHNDFSKVGSGTDIRHVKPEDHTLASMALGKPTEIEKDLKKIDSDE